VADPALRPEVPPALFAGARALFGGAIRNGGFGALGPHAFFSPHAGGTAWAVGPALAGAAHAMLAADQQQPLTDPAVFYPTHLIVAPAIDPDSDAPAPAGDRLDVLGVTIPGIPGVMFGSNGQLAWAGTASEHDVADVYLEQIAPCSGTGAPGDCAASTEQGGVPLEQFDEVIQIGTLGAIARSQPARYEVVPHHGPILPAIDRTTHALVPRTGASALAVHYTGDQPSFELRALVHLARAQSVADGFRAVHDVTYGSQSWVMIDRQTHIGWTTHADIPVRAPAAYGWNPDTAQDALAPFLVLPGGGAADWLDQPLSPRVIPHAIDPAQGFLVAGNADPVGATADGLPLDQGAVDGQPLYAGVHYTAGLAEARITTLLQQRAGAGPLTVDDLAAIQRDTRSLAGAELAPAIVAALDRLDRQPIGPFDVNPYLDSLSPADTARLVTARALMSGWTFATPAAIDAPDPDAAATALFHAWMHYFILRALQDELDVLGFDVWRLEDDSLLRVVHGMLVDPKSFVTSPTTQQPILCDNYNTTAGPDDSCTKVILQAMVDAMTHLESPEAFGTADPSAWRWGLQHRLALDGLTGAPEGGFPRAGDRSSVSGTDPRWQDLDFTEKSRGSALRFIAETTAGRAISVKWALPGGAIEDIRSPHHRDLLDDGYLPEALIDAAFSIDEIVQAGESRWVFH
jgi:penicillin amidase